MKPKRRWRKIATGVVALTMLYFAGSAWQNRRWIDPRFVGAWRVTNSKWDGQSIFVLNEDGSAHSIERRWEGDQWRDRGSPVPYYWSVGRDGFLLQNLDSGGAQIGEWMWSLGGLLDDGKLTAPRVVSNTSDEVEAVSDNQIRLKVRQPGILIPTILTLDRMDPAEVPSAQP